jgi:hypothetical protein
MALKNSTFENQQATFHEGVGGHTTQSASVEDKPLSTRIDEASATLTYVGKSYLGAADADSVWTIQKISVSGSVTTITWATAVSWTGRAGHTYV